MADYKVTDTELTSIANAIRTKGGTSAQLEFPAGFISAVNAIPTGGGGGGDVPSGYTRIGYIQSDGNQYIDTGFGSSDGIMCMAHACFDSGVGAWATLCGAQTGEPGGGNYRHGVIMRYQTNDTYCAWYANTYSNTGISIVYNDLTLIFANTINKYTISLLSGDSYDVSPSPNRTDNNLFLFAMDVVGSPDYYAKGKIDWMQLYNSSGVLVRDFKAVKRNSDNELGLWDSVTETFFMNAGTGDFSGPT